MAWDRWQRYGLHLAGKHGIVVAVLGDDGTRFDRAFDGTMEFHHSGEKPLGLPMGMKAAGVFPLDEDRSHESFVRPKSRGKTPSYCG